MDIRVVNLEEKASLIEELHKYKLIAELNNYQFKLVKAKREFVGHSHPETDEMFFVVEGTIQLAFRDKIFDLKKGEFIVVPKGVEHKPICNEECTVMLIEPKGTLNTGDAGGSLKDTELEWI
ncbi:cupin domain-containing protein [Methanobacterium sp. ACI-7]|uniref:cupin domain-containing protein n=1 Tax=unclassified Methanobacterium TaxID=2627676 RepID=UPI0039C480D6